MDDAVLYAIWLILKGSAGSMRNSKLLSHFKTAEAAYNAGRDGICGAGISEADAALYADRDLTAAENIAVRCNETGIKVITRESELFPERLKNIEPTPAALFVKGNLPEAEELSIAAVGTRKSTPYGEKTGYKICRALAESGVTVISGMARGCDTAALLGALDAGRRCFAVLGTGADVIYPPENKDVYSRILNGNGGIISEYPPGTGPSRGGFPKRNRIMAGLANGVLVTEAPKNSGALITASYALEYGKELFVVPGSLFSRASDGTNTLLTEGKGKAIRNHLDILVEYSGLFSFEAAPPENIAVPEFGKKEPRRIFGKKKEKESLPERTSFEPADTGNSKSNAVLNALSAGKRHSSELAEQTGLPVSEIMTLLTLLELDGRIAALAGGYFTRIS